jgi:hypothetical protein
LGRKIWKIGFSFVAGYPAFQITTTAQYTPPVTVCMQVPSVNDPARFNQLRLLHNENGSLVDRTSSRDFATRTICAVTNSLSPFAVAETLAPTAASVSVSGRVLTPNGAGLRNAVVSLTDGLFFKAAGELTDLDFVPIGGSTDE